MSITATETITVLRPDVEDPLVQPIALAPRGLPEHARLLLLDNGKPKAKELLGHIAAELGKLVPIGETAGFSKTDAGAPLEEERVRELAENCDLVITGLGDCGACSASSLHDALMFERAGVPATVLITDVFIANVARFSESLGHAGYHSLVVPHPAATKSDLQLQRFAADVAVAASQQLT